MAGENFQDNVIYGTDGILRVSSIIAISNSTAEQALVANPTANRTVSFPDSSGTILLSGSAIQGLGVSTGGNTAGNTGTTIGTFVLAGAGAVTLSQSTAAGSLATMTISVPVQTTQAAVNVAAGTQTATSGTVVFSNSNGLSFGMSNSSVVTASADYVRSVSAGTTNATGNQIVFSNSNGVSFGANGATVTASVATSLTNINVSAGTTSNNLSAITFSNSNNVSFGLNASTITATVENRLTAFSWPQPFHQTFFTISDATFSLQKIYLPMHMTATRMEVLMDLTGNTNSTGALTFSAAVYTLSGSTASLASSGSRQISWTSGTSTTNTSVYGGVSGTRYRTLAINLTMTPGDYLLGYHFRTTNNGSWRIWGAPAVSIAGALDANETQYWLNGTSTSSFTTAFPASINVTDTNFVRTGAAALRQPGFIVIGTF
jgi:hypothetical protein